MSPTQAIVAAGLLPADRQILVLSRLGSARKPARKPDFQPGGTCSVSVLEDAAP